MKAHNDVFVLWIAMIFLLFTSANYNFMVSTYYLVFAIVVTIARFALDTRPQENIEFIRYRSISKPFITAGLALAIFFLISSIVAGFGFNSQSISNISTLLFANAPVLSGVKFLNQIIYVAIIPIIETIGLVTIFETLAHRFSIPLKINFKSPAFVVLLGIIGLAFMALHFGTRGLTNTLGLTITFIFAIITIIGALIARQSIGVAGMHSINNYLSLMGG